MARLYTIPPGRSFLDSLAAGLLQRSGGEDPLALGIVPVLLPPRRAGRALAAAFLRASGGRPLALPQILPLGDLDEDALAFEDEPPGSLDLPPAIPPLRRQLLLTRLILKLAEASGEGPRSADQAARLAGELARLLDAVQIERLSFDRLATLVPAEFATHWQITLRFLEVLTREWPRILAAEGAVDPAARRNALIEAQAARWRAAPPPTPVIAAGSTGSMPAVAELLGVVAALPQGEVILPGLDLTLDAASWEALEPSHPQYGMRELLRALDLPREAVAVWPDAAAPLSAVAAARARLVSEVMRPAATTDAWRRLDLDSAAALRGMTRIDAPGPEEEARAIALMLREALEEGHSAALVTPDRDLARRVAAEAGRWGIAIDDSAGRPLADMPPSVYLRLLAAMAAADCAPAPLLAALKHPLAAGGLHPAGFRERVRRLERAALRGPRPEPGFAGLRRALAQAGEADAETDRVEAPEADLESFVAALDSLAAPFLRLIHRSQVAFGDLLAAHVGFAERLAESASASGAARLWAREEGEALARFVSELHEAAPAIGRIEPRDYPALLDSLLAGEVVRPRWGTDPRLAIWGTIEARLLHADHLILGGLNEGVWPPEPGTDPWMSRPMRARFGLPAPERRVGLSAHDFAQALHAPRVTLSRSMRAEGAPTVPSRWLLRLDSVLRAAGVEEAGGEAARWLAWAEALDRPERVEPAPPPFPCPPLAHRPRSLTVADIEAWLRDPYEVYARHVLGLRPLPPIDEDPGVAERGAFVHAALDRFVREHEGPLPADALDRLLALGRAAFGRALDRPGVAAFWWPRFERIAAWVIAQEQARRAGLLASHTRVTGRLTLEAPGGLFHVTARVDRIDRMQDGRLAILEYKGASLPRAEAVRDGSAPEMGIKAAIAAAGGYDGLPPAAVAELAYWSLSGSGDGGRAQPAGGQSADPAALAAEIRAGLERYVAAFDLAATPYLAQPRPGLAPRRSAYAHLARVKEWGRGGAA